MPGRGDILAAPMAFRVLYDYARRAHLDFFRHHPSPFYSLTFEVDATAYVGVAGLRALAAEPAGTLTVAFGPDRARCLVEEIHPVRELSLVRLAHVDPLEPRQVVSHDVDDALSAGHLIRIRRHGALTE